jgi:peptidyl-prolyl cis-trans isomerase B (cyclophilin B)
MRKQILAVCLILLGLMVLVGPGLTAQAEPRLTMVTAKGTIEIQLYQADSPKSVEHILALVKRNFYRGLRIHRAEATLVQFGDPTTRDVSRRAWWGRAGSGQAVGVAEFNGRTHTRGAVSLAHSGDARYADSQLFIVKRTAASLDGEHVVIGRVTSGMDVVDQLEETDVIRNITLTAADQ